MSLPYSSSPNLPFGLSVVTINSVDYVLDSIDHPDEVTRTIQRTDENGDRGDLMIRKSGEFRQGSAVLQLATTSTAVPTSGQTFTYRTETCVVADVREVESKDAFSTVEISYFIQDA